MKKPKACVLGAGNSAHVAAGLIAGLPDWECSMLAVWENEAERLQEGIDRGGIRLYYGADDDNKVIHGVPVKVSQDPEEVFPGANCCSCACPPWLTTSTSGPRHLLSLKEPCWARSAAATGLTGAWMKPCPTWDGPAIPTGSLPCRTCSGPAGDRFPRSCSGDLAGRTHSCLSSKNPSHRTSACGPDGSMKSRNERWIYLYVPPPPQLFQRRLVRTCS